ncbi:MAG: HDOD domain-containing protein [Thiohalomonadaceae bacterium]
MLASDVAAADPLRGLVIPPMPESVRVIREEQAKAEPDAARVQRAIEADVGLAAEVLRAANSAAFGLRRSVGSIPHAMLLLGIRPVTNLVATAALRASMAGLGQLRLERFWDEAGDVALVCAQVAREFTGVSADTAYTLGLFHDCGIPLLLARHADYGRLVREDVNAGCKITEAETRHFGLNHAAVGHHLARRWLLPEEIGLAILHHHAYPEDALTETLPNEVRTLLALLKVGEHVSSRFRQVAFRRIERDEWGAVAGPVLQHLAIDELEFEDLCDSLIDMLGRR